MKKGLPLLMTLLFSLSVRSAQTFFNSFTIDGLPTNACSSKAIGDSLFVIGYFTDTTTQGIASFYAKFDLNGRLGSYNVIRSTGYTHFLIARSNSLDKTSTGELITTGYCLSDSLKHYILFSVFDFNGNLKFYKIYEPPLIGYLHTTGQKVIKGNDGDYYLTGEVQNSSYSINVFLMRLDSMGNEKYFKQYTSLPEYYNNPFGIAQIDDSSLVISATAQSAPSVNYWQSIQNTCFITVDTEGTLRTMSCTTDNNTRAENALTQMSAGLVSCGAFYANRSQGNGFMLEQYIAKWDNSFGKSWELKLGNASSITGFSDLALSSNEDIILVGQNLENASPGTGYNAVVTKVDTNGGLQWYRQYRLPNSYSTDLSKNSLSDVEILSDETICGVGVWENDFSNNNPYGIKQQGIIFRLTSDGCLSNHDCGFTTITEDDALPNLMVFPNPTENILHIVSSNAIVHSVIYDLTGRTMFEQVYNTQQNKVVIDLTIFNPGTFIIAIQGFNGLWQNRLIHIK